MLPTLKLTYAWKLRKILLKFDYNVLNIVQIKNVNVFHKVNLLLKKKKQPKMN